MTLSIGFPHCKRIFKVYTDSEYVDRTLRILYGIHSEDCWRAAISVWEISFFSREKIVLYESKSCAVTDDNEAIVEILRVIRENLVFDEWWCSFHGLAVQLKEKSVLFLGESQAGKTTLAAFLSTQRDVLIISDDIVIINCLTKEVETLRYPLRVREASYDLLTKEYNCQLKEGVSLWNGKRIIAVPYSNETRTVLKHAFCIQRGCDEIHIEEVGVDKYIMNAFCHTNIRDNIRCSVALHNILPVKMLMYSDMRDLYEYMSAYLSYETVHQSN